MLLWLAHYLQNYFHFLRVVQYLTFRSIVSALTALLIVLFFTPKLIRRLTALQFGQIIRSDGPAQHLKKSGTPTMGGSLMLIALGVSVLLWGNLGNIDIWMALLVTLGFGFIGGYDDYQKIAKKNTKGLSARGKLIYQSLIALIAICIL